MNKKLSEKELFVKTAGYKAMGFTGPERKRLLDLYPSKEATKEQRDKYAETFSNTLARASDRHDSKQVAQGLLSGFLALSFFSVAKAAHTCHSPKTMWTCLGISILGALYCYSGFKKVGISAEEMERKQQKAEKKAIKKWDMLSLKQEQKTR